MSDREQSQFFFVGERPSNRALEMKVTWRNGALAATTLFDALRTLDIDPHQQRYRNLYASPVRGAATDHADERRSVEAVKCSRQRGLIVLGMGRIVQRVLTREGVRHLQLQHPAARGRCRLRALYRADVREVLTE